PTSGLRVRTRRRGRTTAELPDANLEGGRGPRRGLLEERRNGHAGEGTVLERPISLQRIRDVEEVQELGRTQVVDGEVIPEVLARHGCRSLVRGDDAAATRPAASPRTPARAPRRSGRRLPGPPRLAASCRGLGDRARTRRSSFPKGVDPRRRRRRES